MPRQRFFLFGTRCNLVRSLRNKHSFYFITKPMFKAIDYFFRWTGNFGLAILIVTVIVKLLFFPLANKSYASMAKMKAVQPEMAAIRERYGDDKMKQQQALMELYKKEKINPLAGCLPIVIQIPVFFALLLEHDLFRKPVPIPDRSRGHAFRD